MLDIAQVAHRLGVAEPVVRQLVFERRLRATVVGPMLWFHPEDVATYLDSCRVRPGELDDLVDPEAGP